LRYSLFQVKSVLNLKVSGSEKLLSVDIFDTLLFRLVESPFEIFDEVGLRSKSEGLLSPTIMEQEFSMLRRSAEQVARKDQFEKYGHNEVTLDQIYEFLPDFIGDKAKLQSLEVKTECEFCYLNPEILKLIEDVNRRNLPVVLTSDMYLNKEQLEDILRSNEFDLNLIKQIYVSCEHSGNKSSGALFRKLQSDFSNIPPEKILHVGDKIEADFHSPRSLGIKAYHYSTTPEGLNKIFEHEKICLTPPSKLTSLRRLAVRFTRKADSIENQLGAGILGPVFTAFVEWVLDLCEQEKISQVFPLTREAELFHPMLENASKGRSWKVKIEPLYVSRESTWLASLTDWNEEELDDLLEKHSISVLEIFQTLGISLPKSFDLEYQDLKAGDLNPKQRENLRDYLLSDSVVESVNQRIASQCESLIEYLDQTVDMTQKSLTVDLGFRGTINSNIEKVMSKERVDSNFVHLLAFGANSTIELKMRGIKVLSFLASPSINQDYLSVIQRSSFLLESLILGRTGSTRRYEKIDGKQNPILQEQLLNKIEIERKAKVFNAIMVYQKLWRKIADLKPDLLRNHKSYRVSKREFCGLIYCMIDLPTPQLAQFLGESRHELNDGAKEIRKVCSSEDFQTLNQIGSEEKFAKVCRINKVHWPQGVLTVSNPHFLLKRKLEQNATDSYLRPMNDLIQALKAKNISEIIIYGAGEAGRSLLTAAQINNLKVECFVDRKETLWGKQVESKMVYSLPEALRKFRSTPIVIGSFHFLRQIQQAIERTCMELSLETEYFSINDL